MTKKTSSQYKSYFSVWLGGAVVFLISGLVFGQFSFNDTLVCDDGLYIYSGQQVAEGIAPYVTCFQIKGPLTPLLSGAAVFFGRLLGFDDILAVRGAFLLISILTVVGLYLLAQCLFESHLVGFLTAFTFLNFWGFARHACSGPRGKTPMVLFVVLSVFLASRRNWFWAALCGCLAALTWQPSAIYPVIIVFLAAAQAKKGKERLKNTLRSVAGALTPVVAVSTYFVYKGAFRNFLDGIVLFHLKYLDRGYQPLHYKIKMIFNAIDVGYKAMAIPILLGFVAICVLFAWRVRLHKKSIRDWLSRDRSAVLLLSFPYAFIWSLIDFQGYPDFYIFLPYAAVGFGWLLYLALQGAAKVDQTFQSLQKIFFLIICAVLIGGTAYSYHKTSGRGLRVQKRWAQQILSEFGSDLKVVSIGAPQALVLLKKTNPNAFVLIDSGIDNYINDNTPGGFAGWLEDLAAYDPDVIVFMKFSGGLRFRIMDWLDSHYDEQPASSEELTLPERGGSNWKLYVRKTRQSTL